MQAYCHLAVFYLDFNFTKFMKFMVSLTFKLAVCVASDDHKHHCLFMNSQQHGYVLNTKTRYLAHNRYKVLIGCSMK